MIHEIDSMRRLIGPIKYVTCNSKNNARNFEVEDTAAMMFEFKNGALGTFCCQILFLLRKVGSLHLVKILFTLIKMILATSSLAIMVL